MMLMDGSLKELGFLIHCVRISIMVDAISGLVFFYFSEVLVVLAPPSSDEITFNSFCEGLMCV